MAEHSKTDIKIDKIIYSNNSINKVINRSFSELMSEDPPVDIKGFFNQYHKIFYDIPKEGSKQSHFTLIEQSTDYLQGFDDPKDAQIESLLNRIEELELQLSEGEDIEQFSKTEENPYFKNGSILMRSHINQTWMPASDAGSQGTHLMERGRKRMIMGKDIFLVLKDALGYKNVDNEDMVTRIGVGTERDLPTGPNFTADSFTNSDQEWDDFLGIVSPQAKFNQELIDKIKELDPNGFHAGLVSPYRFNTDSEYIEALETEINELENVHTHLKTAPDQNDPGIIERIHSNRLVYNILRDVYVVALEGGRDAVASQDFLIDRDSEDFGEGVERD